MFRFGTGFAPLNRKLSEFNHEHNQQSHHKCVKRVYYDAFADEKIMKYKKKKILKAITPEEIIDMEKE